MNNDIIKDAKLVNTSIVNDIYTCNIYEHKYIKDRNRFFVTVNDNIVNIKSCIDYLQKTDEKRIDFILKSKKESIEDITSFKNLIDSLNYHIQKQTIFKSSVKIVLNIKKRLLLTYNI